MNDISEILNSFEPISLGEMDSVKLLNRVDTKFTFSINKLFSILQELRADYRVLEINDSRQCRYKTLYYDTPDLKLYTLHHNGKLNRYKVRLRRYEDSDTNFFEIKFKNNKKRTLKERIGRSRFDEEIHGKSETFLHDKCPYSAEMLVPAITIYYKRITLVSKTFTERLTIDIDLAYSNGDKSVSYPRLVIVELKQDSTKRSPALVVLRKYHIQDVSISKYCFGVASLYDHVKKNNFKPKLKELNKICHESD